MARVVVLAAAAGLVARGPGGADGSRGEASARSPRAPWFATYIIAGAPERVAVDQSEGVATLARLRRVAGIALAADGSVLVADRGAHRVLRIDPQGRIATVAGTGRAGSSGDGGRATAARLRSPTAVAALPGGGLLIADTANHRIRRVFADGTIATVAGCGRAGLRGDGGSATAACLNAPRAVAALRGGGFLIADTANHRIRRVSGRQITTVAGSGRGFAGDGRSARHARLRSPAGVVALARGALAVADTGNRRVRRVSPSGVISTVAGGGRRAPHDVPGRRALLGHPVAVAAASDGALLITDDGNRGLAARSAIGRILVPNGAVRRLTRQGTLRTIFDDKRPTGRLGVVGLANPVGAAVAGDGSLVVADGYGQRVLLVAPRARSSRLAVRFGADRLLLNDRRKTNPPLTTTIFSTRRVDVHVRVLRYGQAIVAQRFTARPGATERRLLDRTDEGDYRVELVARDGEGTVTDALDVIVGRIVEPASG